MPSSLGSAGPAKRKAPPTSDTTTTDDYGIGKPLPSIKRPKLNPPKPKPTSFLDLPTEIRQQILCLTIAKDMLFERIGLKVYNRRGGVVPLYSSGPAYHRSGKYGYNIDTWTSALVNIHPVISADMEWIREQGEKQK